MDHVISEPCYNGAILQKKLQKNDRYSAKLQHILSIFYRKLAVTHTIAILWKEK